MSECCHVPVAVYSAHCRLCGRKGKPVARRTMEHLLVESAVARLTDHPHFFCATPTCPVVYFSNEADAYFYKSDVRVRVGVKETEDPVPICYCFGITEKMVRDEIASTGRTTIPDYIKAQVRAGRCACEIMNPSGRCCLGVVTEVVLRALKRSDSTRTREEAAAAPLPDGCAVTET